MTQAPNKESYWNHLLTVACVVTITCLAYWPALQLEWIWDDDQYVTENPLLRSWNGLFRIWFEPSASPQYYPTVFSTFWIEFQLFGLNPTVFHAINIVLHAATGVLILRIVGSLNIPWAFWIAVAFAVHPIQVESVAWITERKNVLSGFFYASAWLMLWPCVTAETHETPRLRWLPIFAQIAIGSGLFLLALLSKSVTASLPAGILVAVWFKHGRLPLHSIAILCPLLVVGATMGWNTARIERLHVGAEGADWSYGVLDRVGIASHCLVHYAWQVALPLEQVFFYRRFSTSFWDPSNFACTIICAVLTGVFGLLAWSGKRGPMAACMYFAGSSFPALGFLNVYPHRFSFVADHFVYFPIASLLCLMFGVVHWCSRYIRADSKYLATLVPLSLCVWYTFATINYIPAFSNEITLWRDTLFKNPDCPAAMQNLGLRLVEAGKADEALPILLRAAEFDFDRYQTFNSLGLVYKELGRFAEARQALEQSLQLRPNNHRAWTNFAALTRVEGLRTKSESWRVAAHDMYQRAWDLRPTYLAAFGIGTLASEQSDWAKAEIWFEKALEQSPEDADAQYNRAYALMQLGRKREANQLCIAMIRNNPRDRDALALRKQIGFVDSESSQ